MTPIEAPDRSKLGSDPAFGLIWPGPSRYQEVWP